MDQTDHTHISLQNETKHRPRGTVRAVQCSGFYENMNDLNTGHIHYTSSCVHRQPHYYILKEGD